MTDLPEEFDNIKDWSFEDLLEVHEKWVKLYHYDPTCASAGFDPGAIADYTREVILSRVQGLTTPKSEEEEEPEKEVLRSSSGSIKSASFLLRAATKDAIEQLPPNTKFNAKTIKAIIYGDARDPQVTAKIAACLAELVRSRKVPARKIALKSHDWTMYVRK